MTEPLYLVAVLAALIAASEWLVRCTVLRHLGAALLVIVLAAVAVNIGVLPTHRQPVPLYDAVFAYVAPLSIFWLLLRVDLRAVLRAGLPVLALFIIGAAGTVAGVLIGMWWIGGRAAFGELHHALGGMFVGTYTGGSVNFNAVALHYGVAGQGPLYAGAAAVDNAATTLWMAATVALPRLLSRFRRFRRGSAPGPAPVSAALDAAHEVHDAETVAPMDLALVIGLGALAVWGSELVADWTRSALGWEVPSIVVLTTVALVLAQLPRVQGLRGARLLGMAAVMVFLAVIGTLCDLSAVGEIGELAWSLVLFVLVTVLVHGVVTFGAASLLGFDPAVAAVASQANVGGSTSALALARSLGRSDLVLPGVLVGSLGLALGNYLGFATAAWLA